MVFLSRFERPITRKSNKWEFSAECERLYAIMIFAKGSFCIVIHVRNAPSIPLGVLIHIAKRFLILFPCSMFLFFWPLEDRKVVDNVIVRKYSRLKIC